MPAYSKQRIRHAEAKIANKHQSNVVSLSPIEQVRENYHALFLFKVNFFMKLAFLCLLISTTWVAATVSILPSKEDKMESFSFYALLNVLPKYIFGMFFYFFIALGIANYFFKNQNIVAKVNDELRHGELSLTSNDFSNNIENKQLGYDKAVNGVFRVTIFVYFYYYANFACRFIKNREDVFYSDLALGLILPILSSLPRVVSSLLRNLPVSQLSQIDVDSTKRQLLEIFSESLTQEDFKFEETNSQLTVFKISLSDHLFSSNDLIALLESFYEIIIVSRTSELCFLVKKPLIDVDFNRFKQQKNALNFKKEILDKLSSNIFNLSVNNQTTLFVKKLAVAAKNERVNNCLSELGKLQSCDIYGFKVIIPYEKLDNLRDSSFLARLNDAVAAKESDNYQAEKQIFLGKREIEAQFVGKKEQGEDGWFASIAKSFNSLFRQNSIITAADSIDESINHLSWSLNNGINISFDSTSFKGECFRNLGKNNQGKEIYGYFPENDGSIDNAYYAIFREAFLRGGNAIDTKDKDFPYKLKPREDFRLIPYVYYNDQGSVLVLYDLKAMLPDHHQSSRINLQNRLPALQSKFEDAIAQRSYFKEADVMVAMSASLQPTQ